MADIVNLDALVPREDFEVLSDSGNSQPIQTIQIRDVERDSFFYSAIRKPDFQRETNEWGIGRIADFVKSFLDGDLIPAIILWQGGGNIFVIDGSHRLSSLAAWVQDDYGDGLVSKLFYEVLPTDQLKAADKIRRLIKKLVGSYQDHKDAIQHPDKFPIEVVARGRRLASLALQLQWVKGNATKAESSFFKINQQAAPIDKTELRLLQSRNKPNSLAARAIIRAGTGHKYWSRFDVVIQNEIESQARIINELLFTPPELRTPIKTLDLPVAGRGYSSQTLPLVFDLVNLTNDVGSIDIADDSDGKTTVEYLKTCQKILNRITGTHPSSLGLHPVVYFYSDTGRYQPTSFFGTIEFIKSLDKSNCIRAFISVRRQFEDFILKYKMLPLQIVYKFGSGMKGYLPMKDLLSFILNNLIDGKNETEIIEVMAKDTKFSYLQPRDVSEPDSVGATFNTETKSAAFLRDALKEPLRCGICGGLIHFNSISIDHIQRRQDGGLGTVNNAQLTHPFCNTGVKN